MRVASIVMAGLLCGWVVTVSTSAAEPSAYDHLKDLECFVGNWEAKSTIPVSPAHSERVKKWEGKPLLLRMNVHWAAGKSAQVVEYVFEVPGEVSITSTLLRGWDQTANMIKEVSFTTHKGVWSGMLGKDGEKWVSEYTGFNLEGEKCAGTTTYVFKDKDTILTEDKDQTTGGRAIPDMPYQYTRVVAPQPSHYEKLKELEFLVGEWGATSNDGGTVHWTFSWTQDKNFLQNVITGKDANGNVTFSNKGFMGWDPNNRRITNWCVDIQGNRPTFLWEKQANGTWDTWLPGSDYKGSVSITDDGTWRVDDSGQILVFKPVSK